MEENNLEILERLSVLANVLQVGSFFMNLEQLSNDDLMRELKEQNDKYLEALVSRQNEIYLLLKNISERLDKLEKI